MGWMEFVLALLQVVAWPVVVVFFGVKFGSGAKDMLKALAERFSQLKTLKLGPGEGHFEVPAIEPPKPQHQLPASSEASVEQVLRQLPPNDELDLADNATSDRALLDFAPAGAVINAWARLETVIVREVSWLGLGVVTVANEGIKLLRAAGVLDNDLMLAISQLQRLRNAVAHGRQIPSIESAEEYVGSTEAASAQILQAATRMRLRQLLEALHVSRADDVVVGHEGVSIHEVLRGKVNESSQYVKSHALAVSLDAVVRISNRDMRMLFNNGASSVSDPVANRDYTNRVVDKLIGRLDQQPLAEELRVNAKDQTLPPFPRLLDYRLREWMSARPAVKRIVVELPSHEQTVRR